MMLKAFLLLTVASSITYAIVCPPNFCSKVDCEDLTECLEENGQKVREKGDFCQCCDICIKILGEGERCPLPIRLGVIYRSECAEGLYCDESSLTCARETF